MDKNKSFRAVKTAKQRIAEILEVKEKELRSLADQISGDMTAISMAEDAVRKAEASGNSAEYLKAKKNSEDAAALLNMHENRMKKYKSGSLISEAEYKALTSDILKEYADYEEAVKEKLMKCSMTMYEEATELGRLAQESNEVLAALQHTIFRDSDIRFANPLEINDAPVVAWGKSAVTSKAFRNVTDIILE